MRTVAFALLAALSASAQTRIVIRTELGPIEAVLEDGKAPKTVANFLKYVDAGHYQSGRFHRTVRTKPDNQPASKVKIDVIQAGVAPARAKDAFPPVALERTSVTGLRHTGGALSMARSAPDSATSDFFICVGDQPALDFGGARQPDGQGFAVFGRVVKGMDVVQRIHASPAGPTATDQVVMQGNQRLDPPVGIVSIERVK